jgi:hypothetical protein
MTHSPWGNEGASPLGEVPDFAKLDQEQHEHIATLEHTPIDHYPQLLAAYHAVGQGINGMREKVGSPAVTFDNDAVRLLDAAQWINLQETINTPKPGGAFYDPHTGNIYVQFDEAAYTSSRFNQIFGAYIIAHESGHKGTHGIEKYSFHLSEGLADYLAQQTLESGGLASFMSPEELAYRNEYLLTHGPLKYYEYELAAKDVIVGPDGAAQYSRILQLRLVEAIESHLRGDKFNTLLKGAFEGDVTGVKQVLQNELGKPFADSLDDQMGLQDPRMLSLSLNLQEM